MFQIIIHLISFSNGKEGGFVLIAEFNEVINMNIKAVSLVYH
jgi:hypothetical protein